MSVPPSQAAGAAPDAAPPIPPPPGAGRPAPGLSILDFITDGSLAGLCEELSTLTGVPVVLRDREGRRIVRSTGARSWAVQADRPSPGEERVALDVEGQTIGYLGVGASAEGEPAQRDHLRGTVSLLASTAAELCRQQLDLRHRVKELQALYRLSSLLTRATRMEAVLDIALESAIDVLELDAGSIVLFEWSDGPHSENEEDLVLKASRKLSAEWLACPLPLSRNRLFDRLALRGEVVVSEDLRGDERVLIREQVEREGLRGAIHCGLVFQEKAIGVIRLYAREPRTFSESEKRLLSAIAHQAAVAVEQARLIELRERDERVQRQLQLAAGVQRRMLPRGVPAVPRLDLAARYIPSFELGGDFYDFYEMAGNLGVAIGDVAGKGLAAALLMSSVRSSLRAHVEDVYHLDEVLARVNRALCRDTLDHEFATLWYGVIDAGALRLTYCSAGHEPPMLVRMPAGRAPAEADLTELTVGGMAVGIDPSQQYLRGTCDLRPGDVLVAYTDGVTDTLDFQRRRFGRIRLRQAVLALLGREPEAPAARVLEHILWELRQFAGVLERPDDQTLVVLRVRA
ncbi:MAG: GAF domain-containing SpoIIE family protein phosphatase [Phycisphaerales bacterium]